MYKLSQEVINRFNELKRQDIITARELAEKINLDPARVSRLLKGNIEIKKDRADYLHALKLGLEIGISPNRILTKK